MRNSLKKIASLLMALVILFSMAVPTALAAEEIKVPISILIPHAVAGVELEMTFTSGLEYVRWEQSTAIRGAGYVDNVANGGYADSGVLKAGIFTAQNKYTPDANGKLDLGYLVFTGTTAGQTITISEAKFVRVIDKNTTDSRKVTDKLVIDLSAFESGDSVDIDGTEAPENVNTVPGTSGGSTGKRTDFPFVDVKTTDWFYGEVKGAYQNRLIDGKTGTEYKPNDSLTVAEAIKLAAALHQLQNTGKVSLKNGTSNWYSTYVDYAVENGIIEAKYQSYTKAQMSTPATRSEFVHIFHGAMDEYPVMNSVADNAIPDVKLGALYASEIYEFYRAGILVGSNGGYFKPNDNIKRSEVAAILVRMYDTSARQSITLG